MSEQKNGGTALEKIFHEPKRLLIMSQLCASYHSLTFNDLKSLCDASDGNLHRHLKVLEDNGMIKVEKCFVDRKPVTTVALSQRGVERFAEYIEILERIIETARESTPIRSRRVPPRGVGGKPEPVY